MPAERPAYCIKAQCPMHKGYLCDLDKVLRTYFHPQAALDAERERLDQLAQTDPVEIRRKCSERR